MAIKEGDFLIAYEEAVDDGTYAIAGEVAYCNETIKEAKMESLLWKSKARISFVVKIDAEIKDHVDAKGQKVSKQKKSKRSNKAKDETPPPAAVAIRQASVDPQIALFLVTNGSPNAGVQRTQYNIGWGLGVAFSLSDAQIKRASKEDLRMLPLIETLDWAGDSAQTTRAYSIAMSGFNLAETTPSIRLSVNEIIKDAANALMSQNGATPSQGGQARASRRLSNAFVRDSHIVIKPEAIRSLVVKSCIREATANLVKYETRTGHQNDGEAAVSVHEEEMPADGGNYDWNE